MQYKIKDLVGLQFGYLTITARTESLLSGKKWKARWLARCVCGKEITVIGANLRLPSRHALKSCGCRRGEQLVAARGSHGMGLHPALQQWHGAKQRVTNPKNKDWRNYGGRGITMCEHWLLRFENFWQDMGPSFEPGLQLDRRDNEGPYAPWNCRWATIKEQANNKRPNVKIQTPWGIMTIAEAADKAGLKRITVYKRFNRGWSESRLLDPVCTT